MKIHSNPPILYCTHGFNIHYYTICVSVSFKYVTISTYLSVPFHLCCYLSSFLLFRLLLFTLFLLLSLSFYLSHTLFLPLSPSLSWSHEGLLHRRKPHSVRVDLWIVSGRLPIKSRQSLGSKRETSHRFVQSTLNRKHGAPISKFHIFTFWTDLRGGGGLVIEGGGSRVRKGWDN